MTTSEGRRAHQARQTPSGVLRSSAPLAGGRESTGQETRLGSQIGGSVTLTHSLTCSLTHWQQPAGRPAARSCGDWGRGRVASRCARWAGRRQEAQTVRVVVKLEARTPKAPGRAELDPGGESRLRLTFVLVADASDRLGDAEWCGAVRCGACGVVRRGAAEGARAAPSVGSDCDGAVIALGHALPG